MIVGKQEFPLGSCRCTWAAFEPNEPLQFSDLGHLKNKQTKVVHIIGELVQVMPSLVIASTAHLLDSVHCEERLEFGKEEPLM